jgi:hypothetical protein
MFGRKTLPLETERQHVYKPGFGHSSYCLALLPSGLHCGRKQVDPVHIVDPRTPVRHR